MNTNRVGSGNRATWRKRVDKASAPVAWRSEAAEQLVTTLFRLAPTALVAVVTVWVAAIGFRNGLWTTGAVDRQWNGGVSGLSSPLARGFAMGLAWVGGGVPAVVLVVAVAVVVLRRCGSFWALTILAVCGTSVLQVGWLKLLAGRARPERRWGIDNAFPSGHATAAAVIATVVALLLLEGWWRAIPGLYPALMGWSRTELHAHWLSDVLAGIALGAATGVLLLLVAALLQAHWHNRHQLR